MPNSKLKHYLVEMVYVDFHLGLLGHVAYAHFVLDKDELDYTEFSAYSGPCRSTFRGDGDQSSGMMPIGIPA